jgi:hypothetical protein
MDAAGLGVLALAFATLTWVLLGRLDPQQSRRRG